MEAAIDLAGIVAHVTLVEFDDKLRADEVLQRKLRSLHNVRIITSAQTTEVLGDGQKVTGLVYKDRTGGDIQHIDLEGVFVQIGLLPQHRVPAWHGGTVAARRDHRRRPWPDRCGRACLPPAMPPRCRTSRS